jgi:hypothetical protein
MTGISWGDVIGVSIMLLGAWSALLIAIIKWFLANYHKGLAEKFKGLADQITANNTDSARRAELTNIAIRAQEDELRRIDRELLGLRAELPEKYVRREDAIREQVVINAKLDAIAAKFDNIVLRGGKNAG